VTPTHVVIANCGDARALLVSTAGEVLFATKDHKPFNPIERARIEDAKCTVSMKRVNGELAVSRGLGDFNYKQFVREGEDALAPPEQQPVSCLPDVDVIPLTSTQAFLVLCCDGIYDVLTNEQVGKCLEEVRGWLLARPHQLAAI
jgi:protein phosphatase 1B